MRSHRNKRRDTLGGVVGAQSTAPQNMVHCHDELLRTEDGRSEAAREEVSLLSCPALSPGGVGAIETTTPLLQSQNYYSNLPHL